jgi:glycosyltransferase involved in cell wall biosynthesis
VRAHKRPELFLLMARTFPQADFVWVGEGELRQSLQAQAIGAGLNNLSFLGALSPQALAREYAQSDIFVLPSLNEGVPKVTQEAAAAGLAQIIFGHYEAPTVIDGKNGFVVWNDDELIARLGTLLNEPETIKTMGQAGMEMATEWSWEKVAPRWEQRIIDIIEGRRLE